ncbi:redoxin domain-containing protein [Sedimentibacter sp.]|uniref:redoxin domain-containing protein n=1 Tax=Sedimentibacter sp. TaxID=1960295 RepID=UPI0028AA0082|nr:redoxin domain-containing protein [Sedimentibacter sp.]
MGIDNQNNIDTGCITIGRMAPDFTTLSTDGVIRLSQFRGKWVVLVDEPGNFAATSTSSLLALANNNEEFVKRNVQILCLTIDNNFANIEWLVDIYRTYGVFIPFPLLEDRNADIAKRYSIVNPDRIYEQSVRDVFIIGPEGRIRCILTYPNSCGRNTYEMLRIIDSLQLTDAYNVYTPANWMPGDPVMMPTTHSFREALLKSIGQSGTGLTCNNWYSCYTDYNTLGTSTLI